MKEIFEKLNKIRDEIIQEKTVQGELRLLAMIARADLEGKWDILMSADWINSNNNEVDLIYLIEKMKVEFNNNFSFLSRIVLLTSNEKFVKNLAKSMPYDGVIKEKEFSNLQIFPDFSITNIFISILNFVNINLEDLETDASEPIATKEVSAF